MPPRSLQVREQRRVGPRQAEADRVAVEHVFRFDHRERGRVQAPARDVRVDSAIEIELDGVGVEVGPVVEPHALVEREDDVGGIHELERFRE